MKPEYGQRVDFSFISSRQTAKHALSIYRGEEAETHNAESSGGCNMHRVEEPSSVDGSMDGGLL